MSEGHDSRLCALNSLMAVFDGRQPLDVALNKQAIKLKLSKQDKSFAHALCGFVLRYKPSLQARINAAANRKSDITPSPLNTLLLMGAAQIYLMEVPDHAAVNTSVGMTYAIKCSKQKGLINAVLRRLLREGHKDIKPSVPKWLFKVWEKDYGKTLAKEIETASLQEAAIGVVNKEGNWRQVDKLPDLSSDEWVQDFSSYYCVSLLNELAGKTVFDLCAAPGGKTMQLASKDAEVISVDISEKRLQILHENLNRTALQDRVNVVCQDLMKWQPEKQADVIVLDAPCSATGTIRRHPDLPYVRRMSDIDDLAALQFALLERAKDWLKPDGVLVYCTCSLQKAEGEDQIDRFLKIHSDFTRMDVESDYKNEAGDIRLLPTYGDMDGFFVSYLRKS